jgi:hypothetical protein
MQLALIFPDDDGADLHMPGRRALSAGRGAEEFANARVKSSQNLFLKPIGQRTGDQVFGKGSRRFLAALLTPELPKLFDIHGFNVSKPCVEIDGGRRLSRLSFHG